MLPTGPTIIKNKLLPFLCHMDVTQHYVNRSFIRSTLSKSYLLSKDKVDMSSLFLARDGRSGQKHLL